MLTPESIQKIEREIAKYPSGKQQSAVMSALGIAQDEKSWISDETIEFIAGYLSMPPIAVYEVASFYSMYNLEPVGKYKLTVCTNLPCMLSGGVDVAEYLQQKLGIGFNETTPDGKFTLPEGECMGACGDAPVLLVNYRRMCRSMLPEEIDKLLAELE